MPKTRITGKRRKRRVKDVPVIGWREWLTLPGLDVDAIKAKIDTGARTSAIHAFRVRPFTERGVPWVSFVLRPRQRFRTPEIECRAPILEERKIRSSNGQQERRYVIETEAQLGNVTWTIEVSLADRDELGFRMLLGREAILIPPSIALIIYGVWTETSIGKLFVAGIVPGILLAGLFCIMIVARCAANPALGPRGPRYSWPDRFASMGKLLPTATVFGIVLGGIYGGVFTPSEASAIGCLGVVVVAVSLRRLSWKALRDSLYEAGTVSAMVYIIIVGGILISRFLVQTDVTPGLVHVIGGLGLDRILVLALFAIMYLFLGAILDTFSMIILTLPFVFPIVLSLGFDPVWFGIFLTVMIELALITPPIGLNVYVMHNVTPDVELMDIFRGCGPFVGVTLFMVVLIVVMPELVMWLPSTMK